MDLDTVVLSEAHQTEKQKYCVTSCYMWQVKRNDTNELIYETDTDSNLKNKFMVTRGNGLLRSVGLTGTHCYILNG